MSTTRGGAVPLTFLGTGNAFAVGRYWNSFLIGGRVLMEPSPAVLPNLRRAGADLTAIETVFISHFHADHTFGWPFLLLEYLHRTRRRSDLWVVGPPGVQACLEEMLRIGAYKGHDRARSGFELHYVEVDEREQEAGPVRFRALRVDHVPDLDCYGYLIQCEGRTVGYSGDTQPCDGLHAIAAAADVLVVECNQRHGNVAGHMSLDDVRALRAQAPRIPFFLTHLGDDVAADDLPDVHLPADLETVRV
jgi:ribonuclease Z